MHISTPDYESKAHSPLERTGIHSLENIRILIEMWKKARKVVLYTVGDKCITDDLIIHQSQQESLRLSLI